MNKIGVIGTAGRKEDSSKMSLQLYRSMFLYAKEGIRRDFPNFSEIMLVSGGAAWADHIAISLFLYEIDGQNPFGGLTLYLPAPFVNSRFVEESHKSDAGRISNYYHEVFSRKVGGNTLHGIQRAVDNGAITNIGNGFHSRNKEVGKVDVLLAFTWGEGKVPKDGGTKHTWDNSKAPVKIHVPLRTLEG